MSTVTSTLDREITAYLPRLNEKQKQTLLTVAKTFIEDQEDWWNEIGEEEQEAIDKALAEMEEGKVTPHEAVMKKYDQWKK